MIVHMHYDSQLSTGSERAGALLQALLRLTIYSMGMGMYGVMRLLLGGGEYCLNGVFCIQFFSSLLCWGMNEASALVYASCSSHTHRVL